MIRTCSYLRDRRGAFAACLVFAAMAGVPTPMWGQWTGTNPVWTNSNVGIGTTAPTAQLQVQSGQVAFGGSPSGSLWRTTIRGQYSWTALDDLGAAVFELYARNPRELRLAQGTDIVGWTDNFTTIGYHLYGATGGAYFGGNVGIGTTNPLYKLAVNGNIGAQDIIVTNTGWSDYVFRPDYRLRPLSEVSEFIQAHGHLPDIPTEAEVKEKGVSLGDMQAKLLAKVEELTLHIIQQEKENKDLRERLGQLEKHVARSGR